MIFQQGPEIRSTGVENHLELFAICMALPTYTYRIRMKPGSDNTVIVA